MYELFLFLQYLSLIDSSFVLCPLYSDADWTMNANDRKSTSGGVSTRVIILFPE